jgi:hypothetical protein
MLLGTLLSCKRRRDKSVINRCYITRNPSEIVGVSHRLDRLGSEISDVRVAEVELYHHARREVLLEPESNGGTRGQTIRSREIRAGADIDCITNKHEWLGPWRKN